MARTSPRAFSRVIECSGIAAISLVANSASSSACWTISSLFANSWTCSLESCLASSALSPICKKVLDDKKNRENLVQCLHPPFAGTFDPVEQPIDSSSVLLEHLRLLGGFFLLLLLLLFAFWSRRCGLKLKKSRLSIAKVLPSNR